MHGLPPQTPPPLAQAPTDPQRPAAGLPAALARSAHQLPQAGPAARVTPFLLPLGREQIPVWIFVPQDLAHGTAGLVVQLGARELQVFTQPGMDGGTGALRLHLLEGGPGMPARLEQSALVQRRWRRTISHSGDLQGLVFLESGSAVESALQHCRPEARARRWVRCVIAPAEA